MKQSVKHIDFIDYVRGIAILCVFLFHCILAAYGFAALPWLCLFRGSLGSLSYTALFPLHLGWLGVSVFFVVSGFCIHLSFQQQGREWGRFFIRRFFRLYPAYLAALILFALLNVNKDTHMTFQFVLHALLIHNYNPQAYYGINPSFWSIAIEVQLYLLYPFLLMLVSRCGWKVTLIALAACECFLHGWDAAHQTLLGISLYDYPVVLQKVQPYFSHLHVSVLDFLKATPLAYWFCWSLGAFVADAFLKKQPMPLAKSSIPLWTFLVVAAYWARPLFPFSFLFTAVLTTIVISKSLSRAKVNASAPNFWLKQLRRIGIYSYSIYLLHEPLLRILVKVLPHFMPGIYPFFLFLCCVLFWLIVMPLAFLCYRFIELPGIGLGKRIIQRMSGKEKGQGNSPSPASEKFNASLPKESV